MDILIKSFNRPYYLDRCLFSINKFVENSNYSIKILDDGTPQKYLDKIQIKYPNVTILKSNYYDEKSEIIENNLTIKNKNIPIDFWLNTVKNSTDYFLLLEDDFWFTSSINLDDLQIKLNNDNVQLLKLIWLGNNHLISNNTLKNNDLYEIYKPKVFTKNLLLFKLIFNFHRFNFHKIITFLKLYTLERDLNYYHIYSVAGVVFKKDYFLSLWINNNNKVDEKLQIKNALDYWGKNPKMKFAKTKNEILKTGFISSATNQHKEYEDEKIEMFEFNKIINESWFNDDFITTKNLNFDLNENEIESILDKTNAKNAQKEAWKKWVESFKNQFRKIHCTID